MDRQHDDPSFLGGSHIGLVWRDVGNVDSFDEEEALHRALDDGEQRAIRERGTGWARSMWEFARTMEVGDLVLVRFGHDETVQVAEITRGYIYNGPEADLPHARAVKWIKRDLPLASIRGEVHVPFSNAVVALRAGASSRAQMRALLEGKVRGWQEPVALAHEGVHYGLFTFAVKSRYGRE